MGEAKRKREAEAELSKTADEIWRVIEACPARVRPILMSLVMERAIAGDPSLGPAAKADMLADLRDDPPPAPQQRLGDAPVEERYREQMEHLARALDRYFNGDKRGPDRETGFVLLAFPFGENGRCNFISNGADRADIVSLFREMIARFEGATLVETPGRA